MKSDFKEKIEKIGGAKPNVLLNGNEKFPITDNELNNNIANVEKNFESQIPESYIKFIKDNGAITFIKSVNTKGIVKIPIADEDNQISVDNFFGFSNNEASVVKVINRFKGNIPNHVLPICEGAAGDLIVIDLSKHNVGKIYYWYHEHEEGTDGLYLLASNFEEFISNLSLNQTLEKETSTDDVKVTKVSDKFLERLKNRKK